ncbi:MAG: DNA recombination protein RmuC [Bryobacterales bacterium]|nr:DNA recombination protein RmuC [Bryobacterales bacterium]
MDQYGYLFSLIAGFITGVAAYWLGSRARSESERAVAAERLQSRDDQIEELKKNLEAEAARNAALAAGTAAAQTQLAEEKVRGEEHRKAADEKLALLDEARKRLADSFQALSAQALQSNNESFLHLAKATLEKYHDGARTDLDTRQKAIDEVVKPLRESLAKVDTKIQDLEKSRAAAFATLTEQVKSLNDAQLMLRAETGNLVRALRSPQVRGRWGEIQLQRVVELAGMQEYCDFVQQESVNGEEGRLRPDMVVRLPNQRQIVVDSKVSLSAYLESLETSDEAVRVGCLKSHAAQVRAHLTKLAARGYWSQFAPTPEFVVAFLPGETFFSAALEQDPSLIEYGVEQRVILSTPTTLIALLKAIAYGWRQEKLAANAQAISDLGKELHDRIRRFTELFARVGSSLGRSIEAYNDACASFEHRVLVSTRRFQQLGAGQGEEISQLDTIDRQPRTVEAACEA